MISVDTLDFAKGGGLVTVVAQDATTAAVLMVAYADRAAIERTIATGEMHYFSRTRGPWHKGATSGHTQRWSALTADCDGDTVLALVNQTGPACHTGTSSCFGAIAPAALADLDAVIRARTDTSAGDESYTARLLANRNLRLKKLGEETSELVTACADGDRDAAIEEAADLFYHTAVALHSLGASLADVQRALATRAARRSTVRTTSSGTD
jgi:phosphoribosyl-ATP pyrophosphohydrolase/phosphoribosyl-AMP cyclohydrolase